ncbi:MAG: hypothetical protein GXO22_08185 [Aquificae bacterium]|nr:hypothetical protein [Aquificota bacterium]
MINYEQIKQDYQFTQEDIKNILKMRDSLLKYEEEFLDEFYRFIFHMPDTKKYLTKEKLKKHREKLRQWYRDLLSGRYDKKYFQNLYRIGEKHVEIGLPTHYVNASFNFIRRFFIKKINQEYGFSEEGNKLIESISKLLDINLDVLTSAYREEELNRYKSISLVEKSLIKLSQKFADILDFTLVIALIIVSFFVIGLFVYDIYELVFQKVPLEHGIIKVLGSLLILWAVSELMTEEIKHLKGGGFALGAFIGLALAAMIRKILIASLSVSKIPELLSYSVIVLALGIVYWLISRKR